MTVHPITPIEIALNKACAAHAGQHDKAGMPYIFHPLRVMLACKTEDEQIVAVLHDVLEDCPDWTMADLAPVMTPERAAALEAVTRRPDEDYMTFCRRAGANPIARAVKIADLRDNLSPDRRLPISPKNEERLARYRAALAMLEDL